MATSLDWTALHTLCHLQHNEKSREVLYIFSHGQQNAVETIGIHQEF